MKVLVLGGTGFIGLHCAEALLAAGHAVSVLARGAAAADLPPGLERIGADRSRPAALRERRWDVCIDACGYTPQQLHATLAAVHVKRYVYISAVMVYGTPRAGPVDETFPRVTAAPDDETRIDGATYGPLKVACEDIVLRAFGGRATVLRPQIVAGARDGSGRCAHWVRRALQPGPTLAPGDGRDWLQMIDVRDVARFVVRVVDAGIGGVFNLAGPRLQWRDFVALLGVQDPRWVGADVLDAAGIDFTELPLYRRSGSPLSALMDVDAGRAIAQGLVLTDTAATLQAVRATPPDDDVPRFLSRERERALLAAAGLS